jgi:hypothetical protein
MGIDPLLGEVGWSWLTESFESYAVEFDYAEAGTVTRVVSESFRGLRERSECRDGRSGPRGRRRTADPATTCSPGRDLLCTIAGLPPLPEGVVALPGPASVTMTHSPIPELPASPSPRRHTPSSSEEPSLADAAARSRRRGARWPWTPSARRATATASGPIWCRCAARAPGTSLIDPIAVPGPVTARRRDRRRRVDPARGHPGPRLPGRGRVAPPTTLRHRTGRPLLGLPRVGLAATVEHYLGLSWPRSTRPSTGRRGRFPTDWLRYAALDVEVLGELRNLMGVDLAR